MADTSPVIETFNKFFKAVQMFAFGSYLSITSNFSVSKGQVILVSRI